MPSHRAELEALREELLRRRGSAADVHELFCWTQLPMAIVDRQRLYVDANPATLLLLRRTSAELAGLRVDDFVPAAQMRALEKLWSTLENDGEVTGAITLRLPDGFLMSVDCCGVANVLPGEHLFACVPSRWPQDELSRVVGERSPPPAAGRLTERERDVLTLLAQGADVRGISAQLSLSPHTVKTHLRNAVSRLGARHRAHAVALALRDGAIRAP